MSLADLQQEQVPKQRCHWVLVLRPAGAACPQPAPLHSDKMMDSFEITVSDPVNV